MTRPDLDALEALLERATPGPWIKAPSSTPHWHRVTDKRQNISVAVCGIENDAALIAAAVNALPALIARVRELERERDQSTLNRACADALVSAAQDMTQAAALAMRERCAEVCDETGATAERAGVMLTAATAYACAAAIRALEA